MAKHKPGKLIAAFGIPGSGKSTTINEIGKLSNIASYHEPEEVDWPIAVTNRHLSGNFTAIMWFRSMRIPLLYKANELRNEGITGILDSFYDKLFSLYITKPGIKWLFSKRDPFFLEMKNIAQKDYDILPDVDCLLFLKINYETWIKFIEKRNRHLDNEVAFRKQCFDSQAYFLAAAKKYAKEKKCKLVIYDQEFNSPETAAENIVEILKNKNIL